MRISIAAAGASAPSAPNVRAARPGPQTADTSESFQPVWNNATRPAAATPAPIRKDDSSDSETSENSKPAPGRSVKSSDPKTKKQDPAPVVLAADPAPQQAEPVPVLKTSQAPAEEPKQVQPVPQPSLLVEAFALPEPAPSPASPAAATPAIAPTDAAPSDASAPVDPGTLVFQVFINPSDPNSKPQAAEANSKAEQPEMPTFPAPEEASTPPQTRTGGSNAETKNQDQQEQQPQQAAPQPRPAGTDSTIASQFGFQTPLAFAAHISTPKPEVTAPVAPTRPTENVSTPELPGATAVDRIALTIRGVNDQVVRVEINQSGEMVQVGVNTANAELASDLRSSVPELVRRLDQQGYESRVSMPSSPSSVPVPIATAHSEFRSGADTNGNGKSYSNLTTQDEPRQQRQRNSQRAWRELASQLQED